MDDNTEPKKENRGGSRVHHAGYRKVRVEMFAMVEQLICSNAILSASLQHNEVLQRKCLNTIKEAKAKVTDLQHELDSLKSAHHQFWNSPEQLQHQLDRITVIQEEGEKAFKSDKEVN
jgi:hypothetical protein